VLLGDVVGVAGTVDEGTVLGPAVGAPVSLHPARRTTASTAAAVAARLEVMFINAILR